MTTYPDELVPVHGRFHDGLCDFCKALGYADPHPASHGALRGQGAGVGPAACDDHDVFLDARLSTTAAWMVVDQLARESADDVAAVWPLGSLAVEAGTRRVGMVTAHGPRRVRLLFAHTGEVVVDVADVARLGGSVDLRDVVRCGADRRRGA